MKPAQHVSILDPVPFSAPCPKCKATSGYVDIMGGVHVVMCRCGKRAQDIKGRHDGKAAETLNPGRVFLR